MTAWDFVDKHFGTIGFVAAVVMILIGGLVIHLTAKPGGEISFLFGLWTYDKDFRKSKRKKFRPIEIIAENTESLWMLQHDPREWINADLHSLSSTHVDSILSGPFHRSCKTTLAYYDGDISDRYYVRRSCPECDVQILDANVPDRLDFHKRAVLEVVKQRYMQGSKIRNGMRL